MIAKSLTVAGCQIINRFGDTIRAHARASQITGFINASGNHHRIMFGAEILKADVNTHCAICHNLNAAILQLLDTLHHNIFFQFKARNAIGEQAACAVVTIIDRDLQARPAQHISSGKATRACTNYANRLTALRGRFYRLDPPFGPSSICDVFFNRANGHCLMARFLNHAIAFAQTVLRANSTANFREGISGLANFVGFAQTAFSSQTQPIGNIVVKRAMGLAIGHTTLAAPAGLLLDFGLCKVRVDLTKVMGTIFRIPFFRHQPRDLHKFKHRVLSHHILDSKRRYIFRSYPHIIVSRHDLYSKNFIMATLF